MHASRPVVFCCYCPFSRGIFELRRYDLLIIICTRSTSFSASCGRGIHIFMQRAPPHALVVYIHRDLAFPAVYSSPYGERRAVSRSFLGVTLRGANRPIRLHEEAGGAKANLSSKQRDLRLRACQSLSALRFNSNGMVDFPPPAVGIDC